MSLALKVDENLPIEATQILQAAGFDAQSVHDQQMVGSSDAMIAKVCQSEKRVILTLDLDFADIRTYPPETYFGLVILRLERQDKQRVVDVLEELLPKLNAVDLIGKLWIVTEHTIRIRG